MSGVNQFTYRGKRSYDDMELIITETPAIVSAERDISFISVPGRNGDIIEDNGRYLNVEKEYKVAIIPQRTKITRIASQIALWLQSSPGYSTLADTYDPNYFRLACYNGKLSVGDILRTLGTATLKFNCKPFKYSFAGQRAITLTDAGAIFNPEGLVSLPKIKICGSGNATLSIGNSSFAITDIDEYIEIDSEIMSAYKGITLKNSNINFANFPNLDPGVNNISWVGDIDSVEITPRWCTL